MRFNPLLIGAAALPKKGSFSATIPRSSFNPLLIGAAALPVLFSSAADVYKVSIPFSSGRQRCQCHGECERSNGEYVSIPFSSGRQRCRFAP